MSQPLRICLFNPDIQLPLHQPFHDLPNIRILGQVASSEELLEGLGKLNIDLLVVNLDAEGSLELIEQFRQTGAHCGILGVSKSSDHNTIIQAMRAGCNQYVCWPIDPHDLQAALNQINVHWQKSASSEDGSCESRRICVIGASGGAGTTTVACNLAIELASLIHRECGLVDLNIELGDIGCLFDCQPVHTVADMCKEGAEVDRNILAKGFHKLPCNVAVLVRPHRLEEVYEVMPESVASMLNETRSLYPFVVVDLPRSFGPTAIAALQDTDRVLIVTQLSVASIRNATRIHDWLRQVGIDQQSIDIVLNRCSSSLGHITSDDVESHFGKPIFASIPNDYKSVQALLDVGYTTASRDDERNAVQLAIREMGQKLAKNHLDQEEPAAAEEGQTGLFKRLWGRKQKVTA